MDIGWVSWYSVLGITSAMVFLVLDLWRRRTYGRLPPGPPGWPIVGNLLQLGNKPNESLFYLATQYGPIMSLSLGMKTTVVVSSPTMAKEILKTHDHVLAGRTVLQSVKYASHEKASVGWAQCGSYWRMLRRISNTELFSVKRLENLQHLRRDQVLRTIHQILQEVLKTHDQLLAGRTVIQSVKPASHDKYSFVWAQYGSHWRMLRRISNTELFSAKRLGTLQHLRRDQVLLMIQRILQESIKGKSINIEDSMAHLAVSLLGNMAFSKDMFDPHSQAFQEFKNSISKMITSLGAPNLADYFPFLQRLDPQGVGHKTKIYIERVFGIIDKFIEDRLAKRGKTMDSNDGAKDLLDVLLDMRNNEFTLIDIRSYLTDILGAGIDTTAKTMEWAMAELIRNPEKMKGAQAELDQVVGRNRRVEESDTESLPYLCAVVKEVFRLHPVGPLLLPHRAVTSCEIEGYLIPKDTQIIVNVWAIGRDPAIWNEPLKFMPERFMDTKMSSVDFKGQHFELLPFGAGRRMCVGLPLASRIIHLVLASLLHSFEWAPPKGMTAEHVDMAEKFGVVMQKAVPLEAMPTPRLPPDLY